MSWWRSTFIKMKQKFILPTFLCFVYIRKVGRLWFCSLLQRWLGSNPSLFLWRYDETLWCSLFFVSVKLLLTKSMNNFKIHKPLKKKHPEIFYILYSRCSMYIFYRIKRWTKTLQFMDFTNGTVSLKHWNWIQVWFEHNACIYFS